MSKYYAVKNGRKIGVFNTWEECEKQVKGYSNAIFKSFSSKEDALAFIEDKKVIENIEGIIAYVDGSYNVKTKEYGYGCVIIEGGKVIKEILGKNKDIDLMRNVSGEIQGCLKAIEYGIENHYPFICIYYDYTGIEKWAIKEWKANKRGTIEYQNKIQQYNQKINISFIKVLAHSGDYYNERADKLARKAVGILE